MRVCHALMIACFTGAYVTAEQEEWRKAHATLGYTLGGLAIFRLLWGVVGTRYARFASSLGNAQATVDNLRQLPYGWAKRYTGHSPVGALCLIGVLVLALVVSASGWASSAENAADWLGQFHAISANTLWVFAGFYTVAVAFGSWRAGDSLLLSIFRGTKLGSPTEAIQNARHGVAMLLVAAVLSFWWYQWQSDSAASALVGQLAPVSGAHSGKDGAKP